MRGIGANTGSVLIWQTPVCTQAGNVPNRLQSASVRFGLLSAKQQPNNKNQKDDSANAASHLRAAVIVTTTAAQKQQKN